MTFEDLAAWQQSRQLVSSIYDLTRQDPLARDFGLTSQIQRAAVSVMANIAEGFERAGIKEKLQFYNIARASLGETRSLLYVVIDNYPVVSASAKQLQPQTIEVGKILTGLIKSTQSRNS